MCECRINRFLAMKMTKGEIFILIGGNKFRLLEYGLIEDVDSLWYDDQVKNFRVCCVKCACWSNSKYGSNHISNSFELLRELSKIGDNIAQNAFKEEFKKKLMDDRVNDYYLVSLLRDNNLDAFDDNNIVYIIDKLGAKVKLLVRAISKIKTALRIFPILEQSGFSVPAKNLVSKFITKHISLMLDNEEIWEFTLKYPKHFNRFFPDAIAILNRRSEFKRADFLTKIYRSV